MNKKKKSIGGLILASAIIWGAVIIGCAYKLKGTECYESISLILFGGVLSHIVLIWGPLGVIFGKDNNKDKSSRE